MRCIYCGANYNKVLNSRDTKKETQIWRRRKCLNCGEIYTTYEMIDLSYLKVEKRGGRIERFLPIKIYAGIFQACLYSKRADKGARAVQAKDLYDEIMLEIAKVNKKTISTVEINELIYKVLYKKAPEVFLRYLAYVNSKASPRMLRSKLKGFTE